MTGIEAAMLTFGIIGAGLIIAWLVDMGNCVYHIYFKPKDNTTT